MITLGVIGVVAALTMPVLITDYQKKTTAKKVSRFYTMMYNAINATNSEEGNSLWIDEYPYKDDKKSKEFYDRYLDNKIVAYKKLDWYGNYVIGLSDGSAFIPWFGTLGEKYVFFTYCTTFEHCKTHRDQGYDGINGFLFIYDKTRKFTSYCSLNDSRDKLLSSCEAKKANDHNKSHCCSALLMKDNWEIEKDYPWK